MRISKGEECYNWITPEELFKYGTLLTDEEAKAQEEAEAAVLIYRLCLR